MQSGMFVHKSRVYVTGTDASGTVSLFFLEGSSEASDTPTHDSDLELEKQKFHPMCKYGPPFMDNMPQQTGA